MKKLTRTIAAVSAQAVILFLFTGVLTLIMFKISGDSEDLA